MKSPSRKPDLIRAKSGDEGIALLKFADGDLQHPVRGFFRQVGDQAEFIGIASRKLGKKMARLGFDFNGNQHNRFLEWLMKQSDIEVYQAIAQDLDIIKLWKRADELGLDHLKVNELMEWLVKEAGSEVLEKFKDNPQLVDSWKILDNAGRNSLKFDPDVLTKMDKILQHNKLDDFLPINTPKRNITNRTELVEQIVKLQGEAAGIVGKRMSGMGDLMDDLDYFLANFADKPGAVDFIEELTEQGGKMAGASFVLKALRHHADKLGVVQGFETTVATQADEVGDIIVDVITDRGSIQNVFNEFKNWNSIPAKRYESFTRQFVGYLTNKDVDEFSYFFKKGVDGNGFNDLAALKNQVAAAVKNQKDQLYNLQENKLLNYFDVQDGEVIGDANIDLFLSENFSNIFNLID